MSEQRIQYQKRVEKLVDEVKEWAEPHEWVTKPYTKRFRDSDQKVYEIPCLFLQKGPTRVLLDPIAYDAPGSEAVVDLYLMPAYDDLARLLYYDDRWMIHYTFPSAENGTHTTEFKTVLPLNEETINQVLESIFTHAVA